MSKKREEELEIMARKMILMDPTSLRIMSVLADGLMAKEELDKKEREAHELQEA